LKAIILAAGRGSRLNPFTEKTPKCLTVLGGQTLIERQLETLRDAGISDILIVTGYQSEQLNLSGTRLVYNSDWASTNMVESLFCAKTEFETDLIICYSDIVYEPSVLSSIMESPNDISVAVDDSWLPYWKLRFDDPLEDAESLVIDESDRILEIGSKVDTVQHIDSQYIGLLKLQRTGVESLTKCHQGLGDVRREWMDKRDIKQAYMTDLLMEAIHRDIPVHATHINSGWLEIDTVNDLELANRILEGGALSRFFNPNNEFMSN
jgi:L-glutamine-phosphate cytidylyltransferase